MSASSYTCGLAIGLYENGSIRVSEMLIKWRSVLIRLTKVAKPCATNIRENEQPAPFRIHICHGEIVKVDDDHKLISVGLKGRNCMFEAP